MEQRRARRRCRIDDGEALRRCQCVQEEPALAQPPRRHCAPVAAGKSSGTLSSSNGLSDSSAVFSAACTGGTCMPPSRRRWKRSNGAAVRRALSFFMAWRRKWHYFYSRRTPYALKGSKRFRYFLQRLFCCAAVQTIAGSRNEMATRYLIEFFSRLFLHPRTLTLSHRAPTRAALARSHAPRPLCLARPSSRAKQHT